MGFPDLTYGIDKRCGRRGLHVQGGDNWMIDRPPFVGTGYELRLFRGEWLCPLCIIQIKDLEAQEIENERYKEKDQLLSRLGFSHTVPVGF